MTMCLAAASDAPAFNSQAEASGTARPLKEEGYAEVVMVEGSGASGAQWTTHTTFTCPPDSLH